MSLHQLKVQKDALHSVHKLLPDSNEASLPLQTTFDPTESAFNRATIIEEDEMGQNNNESANLSELESGEESWATMSEIDSQYTRSNNSVRLSSLELSRISDSEDANSDDGHEKRDDTQVSRFQKPHLLPPLGMISTPTGIMGTKGFADHFQQHNSISGATILGGPRLISPRESDFTHQPRDRHSKDEQDRLKEAEAQVLEAREELARVTKHLEDLQEQHEIKVRGLQDELAAMRLKEQEEQVCARTEFGDDEIRIVEGDNTEVQQTIPHMISNSTAVAVIDAKYEDELDVARKQKEVAESKLEDAIKSLRMVEAENQKLVEESNKLQNKLESTIKKVHFAEDQNSTLEHHVHEYKTKWEDSLEHAQLVEAKLLTTQSDLENAERKLEVIMESCEMAVANAAREATKERSLREEHAKKEHLVGQELSTQYQKNEKLEKEQLRMEKTVQSLQHERSCLQQELSEITSRRNDVEVNLTKANEECHRLTSELENVRTSMQLLESDHKRKQKNLEESLETQLEELRTSVAILAEKDEFNGKRLSAYEVATAKLKSDADLSQLKEEELIQVEQRLMSDLNEARKDKEASDLKLEELQKSIDALISENDSNKKLLSERKAELLKVKKESKAAKRKLRSQFEKEEAQLLSKLNASDGRAREEKELLDAKINELRQSVESLVAKDESNQKLISDYETELLNLQADFDAAMLKAESKHKKEQQKSREIRKLICELDETREKVVEQKKSSDSEIDEFRKSIDDLIAKDELELDMLRKSIDALAFKDELNQQLLSEREEEEMRLKASSKAAMEEANAKFELEQRKSTAVEEQLLSDLESSNARTRNLQLEKETLEKSIDDLNLDRCRLDNELAEANERWRVAEANFKRLEEEKRLLSADLSASRYSVLRLEAEQSRALVERDTMIKSHQMELVKQNSMLLSCEEMKTRLQKELNVLRSGQRGLEQDKNDLETRLATATEIRDQVIQEHDISVQEFQRQIEELQTENACLERNSIECKSAKSDAELRFGNLEKEFEALRQSQNQTKIELNQKSNEYEQFLKDSKKKYKDIESERDGLKFQITSLHLEELKLEGKINTLVNQLEDSRLKLEEKEKAQQKLDRLLSRERKVVAELEDEKEELMRKTTSMAVKHARSLLEYEEKAMVAEAKVVEIEEECANLKADLALTTAAKATLSWKQKAVKEALTQSQKAHEKAEGKITKLLLLQQESKSEYEKKIAELNHTVQTLESEKKNCNRVHAELQERLGNTKASLDNCKVSLCEKETELTATTKMFHHLQQEKSLLIAEKDSLVDQNASMIAAHSKKIEDYENSVAVLKKELETMTNAIHSTKRGNEELVKSMKMERTELRSKLTLADSSIDSLGAQVQQLEMEKKNLEDEVRKNEKREESLLFDLRLAKEDNDSLKTSEEVLKIEQEQVVHCLRMAESKLVSERNDLLSKLRSTKEEKDQQTTNLIEANTAFQSEAEKITKDNSCLLSSLDEARAIIATLTEEVNTIKMERSSLNTALTKAEEATSGLLVQVSAANKENSILKIDLKGKKEALMKLKGKVDKAAKEHSVLNASLNAANESIAALKTLAAKTTKESSTSIATLKKELKISKGTISTLQTEAIEAAKEKSCLIAKIENNLQRAKGTISTLQKERNVALVQNSESHTIVEKLRLEMSAKEKLLSETKLESEHLRAEMEGIKENLLTSKEKSRKLVQFRSFGEDTIRRLQNDLANETKKTASVMKEIKLLSRDKNELESRLKEAEEILAKTLEAQKARNELVQEERELESKSLQRQLDNAYSHSTHLGQVVSRLESEIKSARDRSAEQEYLRSLEEEKVEQLRIDLKEQTKLTKKLGKLLKRTMNSVTRVSRLKMNVDLCYYDTSADEYRQMPRKAEYSGGVIGSKLHGAGVMTFDCGDVYMGTFDNGAYWHNEFYEFDHVFEDSFIVNLFF